MRALVWALVICLGLSGCASLKEFFSPAPAAPPPPEPSPSPPPPVLSPQVSAEEDARLRGDAQNRMTGTETLLRQVDSKKLAGQQQENLRIIASLLASAKDALYARDTQRARTLAEKAYLLAEDLVRSLR